MGGGRGQLKGKAVVGNVPPPSKPVWVDGERFKLHPSHFNLHFLHHIIAYIVTGII